MRQNEFPTGVHKRCVQHGVLDRWMPICWCAPWTYASREQPPLPFNPSLNLLEPERKGLLSGGPWLFHKRSLWRILFGLVLLAGACSSGSQPSPGSQSLTARRSTTTQVPVTFTPLCRRDTYLPCARLTPGSLNVSVTQATIKTTICVKGWTSTIRPSVNVTNALKIQAAQAYGYTHFQPANYEGDHLISLELGGNPEGKGDRDISNFWDEPRTATGPDGQPAGALVKDHMENWLRGQVCSGKMSLAQAQSEISENWYRFYVAAHRPLGAASTSDD